MSAPPPQLQAFHLGYVVRDIHASMEHYRRLLGVDNWHVRENESPGVPWDPELTGGKVLMTYGRGAGQTFEFIQVIEGYTAQSRFLERYGEGINHIGFWAPDLRESLQGAASCVKKKFLIPCLDQRAWPKPIHNRRRATSPQKCHLHLLAVSRRGNDGSQEHC